MPDLSRVKLCAVDVIAPILGRGSTFGCLQSKKQIVRWGRLVKASGFNIEDRGSTR
ncbi:MAG TPA: hypothetical protein VH397_21115 [Xanthobacteraceae bacterium]|jgi:hypothetical protein